MDFSTLFRTKENLNLDKNTLTVLRYIAIFGQFIAINELSPIKGFNSYNFLVAKLAYKILSYVFEFKR